MKDASIPKVSVCLPVFNGAPYLAEAIQSVLEQTFTDFELIIADDNSTDGSAEIAAAYAARDNRIIFWTNTKRQGLFANYNACLAKSRGTFIKLFAQDDLLESNAVARMSEVLEKHHEVALVSGGKCWIDESGKELKRIVQFVDSRLMPGKDVVLANLIVLGNWVGEPSVVMFRSRDIGSGFDQNYYHYGDIEYWFRLLAKGDLFYINDIVCKFRRHGASTTQKNLTGLYFALDILRLGAQYQDILAELGESQEHFSKRAVETIALHVDHLVHKEGLNSDKLLAAELASPGPQRESMVSDNYILRQSLFHFSRRITGLLEELIETKNELEHRQAECERLWAAVNQMSKSVSWRLTAPLRNVREKMSQPPTSGGTRL